MTDSSPLLLLNGVRIVELGRSIAAPLAGMVLAEQGAEVVRVVLNSDDSADPVLDAILARGKTEVRLDTSRPEDRDTLYRLLAQTDILVENMPAGTLDAEAIRRSVNPGLISCSLPGFLPGDERAALPDYEAVAGTAGFLYDKPIGAPQYHELPVGSVMAGLHAANAMVACLIARLEIGRGQHIETSVYHANLFAQVLPILVKTGVPRGFLPLKMIGTPFMSSWLCGDGRYIYLHITLPAHNARILEMLLGLGYGAEVGRLRGILSAETARDPSQVKSIPEAKGIRAAYAAIFLTRSADEWEKLLGKELCCIKVRTVEEWVDCSLEAGMTDVCEIDDPVLGALKAPGPAVHSPDRLPVLRARSCERKVFDELLARWEAEPRPKVIEPTAKGAEFKHPLQGIRVVDLSRVIAGPCAARVLAEFGAEVVSVQSPSSLDWALSFHLVFNAGKKSVTLDFTTEEGKKKLWALLDELQPHAFLQNYRHLNVAKAAGVHPEAMFARFPGIVYTHLNAYGNEGSWQDRPGFEQVVQAVTGIQLAYGRGGRPKLLPTPIIDIGSGLSGALATLLGLYHHKKTGKGSFAATHLTSTAVLFQMPKMAASQRKAAMDHAGIAFDPGREIVGGIVRGLDAFGCVAGPRADITRWLRAAGLWKGEGDGIELLMTSVKRFWMRPLEHWQATMLRAGVAETVVLVPSPKMGTLLQDIRRTDPGPLPLVRKRVFPGCPSELTFVRNPVRMGRTPIADVAPSPERGRDTREVLGRIGETLAEGAGVVPYPENKPLLAWVASFVRWGYFAWRSGNI